MDMMIGCTNRAHAMHSEGSPKSGWRVVGLCTLWMFWMQDIHLSTYRGYVLLQSGQQLLPSIEVAPVSLILLRYVWRLQRLRLLVLLW